MTNLAEIPGRIAAYLLEIEAVALRPKQPFTWTSGIKSPIYCDNRLTMSYPEIREYIAESFAAVIREQYPDTEVIAGTATAGIPHAAWVAQKMNLPMAYIRDKAKGHGKENQIEGSIKPGQKVIVIEDLISTGGSSIKAFQAVKEAEPGRRPCWRSSAISSTRPCKPLTKRGFRTKACPTIPR